MTGPTNLHDVKFPGESGEYREARNQLLRAELELDQRIQELSALRRQLPSGGALKQNYTFDEFRHGRIRRTQLSELFSPGKDTLVAYSFMYGPAQEKPCPSCSSIVDALDGNAVHISDRVNLVVIAKSPIERIQECALTRGWRRVRLLSSNQNTYNHDYFAETPEGHQMPAINVFTRRDGQVHHFWSAEMLYVKRNGDSRHADSIWPLWNVFDLTPEGRGTDWHPKLSYEPG